MEAGAPTPSLTLYIIDYARLQISLEKDTDTKQGREQERGSERKGDVVKKQSPES